MNQDIFEGLKVAIGKGESLEEAMQTFYNSGYDKTQIEEAARALQKNIHQEQIKGKTPDIIPKGQKQQPQKFVSSKFSFFPERKEESGMKRDISYQNTPPSPIQPMNQTQEGMQKVSDYEQQKPSRTKMIILVSLLIIVIGAMLAGLFFLRETILDFFNNIFK